MRYSKKRKQQHDKKITTRATAKLKAAWIQKRPVILVVGGFFLLMSLFYMVWMSDYCVLRLNPVITSGYATISSTVLNLMGVLPH